MTHFTYFRVQSCKQILSYLYHLQGLFELNSIIPNKYKQYFCIILLSCIPKRFTNLKPSSFYFLESPKARKERSMVWNLYIIAWKAGIRAAPLSAGESAWSLRKKCWRDKSCLREWEDSERQDMTQRPWEKVKLPPLPQTQMAAVKLGLGGGAPCEHRRSYKCIYIYMWL